MKNDPRKSLKDYARFSGMAFQMAAIILGGVAAGWKLDQWIGSRPVFLIILTLASVILSIYFVTRDLLRK